MSLVTCAECGSRVSNKAPACVKCGAPLTAMTAGTPPNRKSVGRALLWTAGCIVGIFWLLVLLGSLLPPPDAKQQAASEAQIRLKQVIDLCWKEQARMSLAPETQRFIAGTCEMAEEDYRTKYGHYYTRYGKKP